MPQLMSREAVCVGLKAMLLQFGVAADARSTDDPDTRRAFTLSAAYTADLLRNASGGLEVGNTYLDNLDITLAIDGEQAKRLLLVGNRELKAGMQQWLGLSPFAKVERRAG